MLGIADMAYAYGAYMLCIARCRVSKEHEEIIRRNRPPTNDDRHAIITGDHIK